MVDLLLREGLVTVSAAGVHRLAKDLRRTSSDSARSMYGGAPAGGAGAG